jgi:hypothetical protein
MYLLNSEFAKIAENCNLIPRYVKAKIKAPAFNIIGNIVFSSV